MNFWETQFKPWPCPPLPLPAFLQQCSCLSSLSSVQFSRCVPSDSLWTHGLRQTRLPLSITSSQSLFRLMSIKYRLDCHPTISSSAIPFSFCLQSFPTSGSFPRSQFSTSSSQSIGASALALVLPMNIQDWFPLILTGLMSLRSKGLSSLLQHHSSKASILQHSAFVMVQLSYPYMPTGKTIALTRWTFVGKIMSLLFNIISRLVIAFLPRSKGLFMAVVTNAVNLEPKKIKVSHCSHCFSIYLFLCLFAMEWWDWSDGTSFFEYWVLSQLFHSPLSSSSTGFYCLCFLQ